MQQLSINYTPHSFRNWICLGDYQKDSVPCCIAPKESRFYEHETYAILHVNKSSTCGGFDTLCPWCFYLLPKLLFKPSSETIYVSLYCPIDAPYAPALERLIKRCHHAAVIRAQQEADTC